MSAFTLTLIVILAYLLGSIPFGYLLVRIFRSEDIRKSGSGNIGATNVVRSGAKGLGAATFLLDALKGFVAVAMARELVVASLPAWPPLAQLAWQGSLAARLDVAAAIAATAAVLGHIYPVWLRFRGGKGGCDCLWRTGAADAAGGAGWPGGVRGDGADQPIRLTGIDTWRDLDSGSHAAVARQPLDGAWPRGRGAGLAWGSSAMDDNGADPDPGDRDRKAPREYPEAARRHGVSLSAQQGAARVSRITVMGAGAWGTALAISLSRASQAAGQAGRDQITLWAHSPVHGAALALERENKRYLPGHALPPEVTVTTELAAAGEAEILVAVIPSEHTRGHFERIRPYLRTGQLIVSATKGIEDVSYLRMTEVIAEVVGRGAGRSSSVGGIGVLSGPSFAEEVAGGLPAALTVAFAGVDDAALAQTALTTPNLRLYRNQDVAGVELGGALKNVIAIAAGAVSGSGLGHNATAAIITRGIAETTRLALACGGRRETLAGLSGIGDLVLTCTGALSRNRLVGEQLGRGERLDAILAKLGGKVAEGVRTTRAALGLAARHGVEMPIAAQVGALLSGVTTPREAMQDLMSRAAGDE